MHEHVVFCDDFENILIVHKVDDRSRIVLRSFILVKSRKSVHFHKEREIDRTRNKEDIGFGDPEFLREDPKQPLIDALLDLKPDDLAPLALLELLLDLLQKVFSLVLVDVELGVSHDPIRVCAQNAVVLEQVAYVLADYFLKKDNDLVSVLRVRKIYDSREYRRHLYGCKFDLLLLLLLPLLGRDQRADIERLIADERERSRGIHGHRREDRINILLKIAVEESALCFCQIVVIADDLQTGFLKSGQKRSVVGRILLFNKCMHRPGNLLQLLSGIESGNVFLRVTRVDLVL